MKVIDTYNAIVGAAVAVLSYIFGEHGIYRWRRRPEPCCRVPEGCRQTASGTGEVDFAGEIIKI